MHSSKASRLSALADSDSGGFYLPGVAHRKGWTYKKTMSVPLTDDAWDLLYASTPPQNSLVPYRLTVFLGSHALIPTSFWNPSLEGELRELEDFSTLHMVCNEWSGENQ